MPLQLAPDSPSTPGPALVSIKYDACVVTRFVCCLLPCRPAALPPQIITRVQGQASGSGLVIPASHALPAGPFPGWPQYVELMQACWARNPADRPHFDAIVRELR